MRKGMRPILIQLGLYTVVTVVLLAMLNNTMANPVGGDTVTYQASFDEVPGLRGGDDVRAAGVKVGAVKLIELDGNDAKVTFELKTEQKLFDDTGLVIRYQNLLGQRYISLVRGDHEGEQLSPGDRVPLDRTSPGFDLTALLNGFRPLFEVLQPEDINKLSETVIKVLQGEGGTVAQLLQQTTSLTNYLADRDQVFGEVANTLTPVLDGLAAQGDELSSTVSKLDEFVTALAQHRKDFGQSVDGIAKLLDHTNVLITEARAPLAQDIKSLHGVADMFADNGDAFGRSLGEFGSMLEVLGRITSYRSAINVYLCNARVSVGETVVDVGDLLGGTYSEVCR